MVPLLVLIGTFVKLGPISYDECMALEAPDSISERIIAVAARRFVDDGYGGTSMLAVAKEAKTSKREIYDRFGSKEALFEHVMNYLCALGAQSEQESPATELAEIMADTAQAVLRRFLLAETRGVLVAALGADPSFPDIPRIFWSAGPGQAVEALTQLFLEHPDVAVEDEGDAREIAHTFIMDCVGPPTLSFLFDSSFQMSEAERSALIESAVARTLNRISKGKSHA